MAKRKILFLCTGNCCRSQMAEALLRHIADERFESLSAGSHPAGYIHPLAISALEQMAVSCENQRSKIWDEFATVPVDVVITVCDRAAGQPCPAFGGAPLRANWSLPDPVEFAGTDEERLAFALRTAQRLRVKIEALASLDWSAPRDELRERLGFLGEI